MNDLEIIIIQLIAITLMLTKANTYNINSQQYNGYEKPNVLNKSYHTQQEMAPMSKLSSIAKGVPELSSDTYVLWKYKLELNTYQCNQQLGKLIFENPYTHNNGDSNNKPESKNEEKKEYDKYKTEFISKETNKPLLYHAHAEIIKTLNDDDAMSAMAIKPPSPAELYNSLVEEYQINTRHTRQIKLKDIVTLTMEPDEKFSKFVNRIKLNAQDYNKMQGAELKVTDDIKLQALLLGVKENHYSTFEVILRVLNQQKELTFNEAVSAMKPVAVENQLDDERANKAKANKANAEPTENKQECWHWKGYGHCPRGDKCNFIHGVPGTKRCSNCNGKHNVKRCPNNKQNSASEEQQQTKAMSAMEKRIINTVQEQVSKLAKKNSNKPSYFTASSSEEEDEANYHSDHEPTSRRREKAKLTRTVDHEPAYESNPEDWTSVMMLFGFLTTVGGFIGKLLQKFGQTTADVVKFLGGFFLCAAIVLAYSHANASVILESRSPTYISSNLHQQHASRGSSSYIGDVCLVAGMAHSRFKTQWSLDSACTSHVTSNLSIINKRSIKHVVTNIETANGSIMKSPLMGDADMRVRDSKGTVMKLKLRKVLFVPQASSNLISVGELLKDHHRLVFDENMCRIINKRTGKGGVIRMVKNMFDIVQDFTGKDQQNSSSDNNDKANVADSHGDMSESRLWHNRLCHYSDPYIKKATNNNDIHNEGTCEACIKGGIKRRPFSKSDTKSPSTTQRLDKVMADTCQPFSQGESTHGNKYFFLFVDVHTRKKWIRFGKYKSDLKREYKYWLAQIENETGRKPLVFMPDGGGEFDNNEMIKYLKETGTLFNITCTDCPNQNPFVERANGVVLTHIHKLLSHSGLPNKYWEDAARFAVEVQNAMPVKSNNWKTPNSQWSDRKDHTLERVRTFGCAVWYITPKAKRRKGDAKGRKGIYLGTGEKHYGWKLLDLETRKIVYTRDAYFFEDQFPFNESPEARSPSKVSKENGNTIHLSSNNDSDDLADYNLPEDIPMELPGRPDDGLDQKHDDDQQLEDEVSAVAPPEHRRQSARSRAPTDYTAGMNLKTRMRNLNGDSVNVGYTGDFNVDTGSEDDEKEIELSDRDNIDNPEVVSSDEIALAAISPDLGMDFKSMTRRQVMKTPFREEFLKAEQRELQALQKHQTYKAVNRSKCRQVPITCRWCYDVKRDSENNIILFKARLVAHGFKQVEGVDYNETFAATAQMKSFRVMLALTQLLGLRMTQIDISNAFLHGNLEEEIYMTYPPGYQPNDGTVLRLHKSLYGLKQAGRVWNECFIRVLRDIGFKPLVSDTQVLQYRDGKSVCILGLHVDDVTIACNDEQLRKRVLRLLEKQFLVKDLGEISHYLGMKIDTTGTSIKLSQESYIDKMLAKFKLSMAETADTPGAAGLMLTNKDCPEVNSEAHMKMKNVPFRQLVGSLMYAYVGSRPDIGAVLSKVASFCNNPGPVHWKAAKRILRYMKGTKDFFIKYSGRLYKGDKVKIQVYCDADWAQNVDDRKSTSGYVIMLAGGPVIWSCKKQPTVSVSATEAEFVSLTEATKDVLWLTYFLTELGIEYETPVIHTDSQSAMEWAKNAKHHQRSKHVAIKYFFVRDEVARKSIRLAYISTKDNVADILTKSTTKSIFSRLRPRLLGLANYAKRFGKGGALE